MKKGITAALLYPAMALLLFGIALPAAAFAQSVAPGTASVSATSPGITSIPPLSWILPSPCIIEVSGGVSGLAPASGAYFVTEEPENADPATSEPEILATFCYGPGECKNGIIMDGCLAAEQAAIDSAEQTAAANNCPPPENLSDPCNPIIIQ